MSRKPLEQIADQVAVGRDAFGVRAMIALVDPRTCACGRLVYFVVNRDGETRCIDCDTLHTERNAPHAR